MRRPAMIRCAALWMALSPALASPPPAQAGPESKSSISTAVPARMSRNRLLLTATTSIFRPTTPLPPKEAASRRMPPPAPPPSLSAQVAELAQVKRVLFGEGGAEKKQTELEGLKMWFDFQHQQQQQQQQSGSKNEIDELRRELRGALDEIKRAAVPAPMPLPPPEPAVDVAMLVRTIAETAKPSYSLQDIVALTRQPQEPKTGFSEILQGIQTLAPVLKSMLGLDQMQMLAQQFQQQQSVASRGLRETLSDIQMLQRVVRDLAPKGGGDGESFWGVVNNLVSNLPESAAALGDLVAKIRGQNDVVEEETEEEPVQEPQFPPGLEKHLVALKKAGDDGGRVQKTITMLQFLGKKEPWRSHLVQLVRAAKEAKADASKKPVVLRILKDTLMNFVVANLLTTECVDSIIAAFEKNMDMILNFIATGKTS